MSKRFAFVDLNIDTSTHGSISTTIHRLSLSNELLFLFCLGICLESGECLVSPGATVVYDIFLKKASIPPP